jgi:RNA polymerase sigma-70 factor (ECF subfamily)
VQTVIGAPWPVGLAMAEGEPDRAAGGLLAGDRRAWDEAIARHGRRVVVALLARGIPLERARDLAQEAWTRIIEQRRRGALARIELPGLVIRQALFLARDAERAGGRRGGEATDVAALEDLAHAGDSAERRLLTRELLERAHGALAQLPARTREIFTLCYEEPGLPHAAVAARLGVSVQHVRQTLYEVRARLRALWDEPHG